MTYVLEVELESACLSGRVRRPLYSFDSTQPLGCLGGSVVRASVLASSVSWVRIPPEQLFSFRRKKELFGLVAAPFFLFIEKSFMYKKKYYLIYYSIATATHA